MTEPIRNEAPAPRRRIPALVRNLGWILAGAILTLLVVANPFRTRAPKHPAAGKGASPAAARKVLYYRNPMDPTITSPVPIKDNMGMDYIPVYSGGAAAANGAEVTIDPATEQNMNVRTAPVSRRDLSREIRTVGYLEYDQQKMASVTPKYSGWVEQVFVNYEGQPVRRGQPLFSIYSPELVQTEQELLSAIRFARRMKDAPDDARTRAESLVAAARSRLRYWDISAAQIANIEKTGEVVRTLRVASPATGVVMKRIPGLEGMAVKPGMELFHIADLSTLWMSVEVFEDQLAWLRPGSHPTITLNYFPGETFEGTVRFVEPEVSEKTRTVGLKLEIPNRDGRLRSGMYATAVFEPVAARNVVAVPSLAVLRTGQRNVVIVSKGGGRFEPRDIELGVQGDQYVEVRSGLSPGETVVTSSQFLLDSESNLREAIQKLVAGKKNPGSGHAQ